MAAAEDAGRLLESLGHSVEVGLPGRARRRELHPALPRSLERRRGLHLDYWERRDRAADRPGRRGAAHVGAGRAGPRALRGRLPRAPMEYAQVVTRDGAAWWASGFDLLLTPTMAVPPPPLGSYRRAARQPADADLARRPVRGVHRRLQRHRPAGDLAAPALARTACRSACSWWPPTAARTCSSAWPRSSSRRALGGAAPAGLRGGLARTAGSPLRDRARPQPSRAVERRSSWVPAPAARNVLPAGLAAALPIIVSTIRALVDGWMPEGDEAVVATRSFDVLSSPPRRGLVDHLEPRGKGRLQPRPTAYWLLAIPARLPGVEHY